MRIIIHPILEPTREIDITTRVVAAVAQQLSQTYGDSEAVNWLEAERHVETLFSAQADSETRTKPDKVKRHPLAPRRNRSKPTNRQRNTS